MEEYPKPITKKGTKIILNQMNDSFIQSKEKIITSELDFLVK